MKILACFFALFLATAAHADQSKAKAHRAISSKDACLVDLGDPQFPTGVKASCCKREGGKINDNKEGHPPVTMCEGGKYDGYYVGGEEDDCLVDLGDPQFPTGVKASCCKHEGGKINKNLTGHPPITMCEGGKYNGYYVGK